MRIAIACDHGGFPLKADVIDEIKQAGHEVLDLGTNSTKRVDYTDYAKKAGRALQNGEAERAIVLCGSGIGACIAANKMIGVYAGVCHDTYSAHQGVEHDNMNVLCMGARVIGPELAKEIVKAYLGAEFSSLERYRQRFQKLLDIEKSEGCK